MLNILSHTPIWVYAIFGACLYLGVRQSQARAVKPWRLAVLPLLMVLWGLWSIATMGALCLLASYTAALSLGACLSWNSSSTRRICWDESRALILLPKNYWVLVSILGIFCCRYIFNVLTITQSEWLQSQEFLIAYGAALGFLAGGFAVKLLKATNLVWGRQKSIAHRFVQQP